MTLLATVAACSDGLGGGATGGLRGAPCDFQEDCRPPTVCAKTGEYDWTICTGTIQEAGTCATSDECRFERRDGLPLLCLQGRCAFQGTPDTKDTGGD
ncbi:MAG: hypothetical protein AMXMBFR64_13630 [Myxococcales bacterium]